eukprot:131414-Hanusia_phi.AAC.8
MLRGRADRESSEVRGGGEGRHQEEINAEQDASKGRDDCYAGGCFSRDGNGNGCSFPAEDNQHVVEPGKSGREVANVQAGGASDRPTAEGGVEGTSTALYPIEVDVGGWKHFKRARAQALEVRDAPNRLAGYSVPGTP